MLLGCNDAVMGPANSLCALTFYSMYIGGHKSVNPLITKLTFSLIH